MFDLNKIKDAASKLGMEIKVNSSNPGMHFIMPDGTEEIFTYAALKKSLDDEFHRNNSNTSIQYNIKGSFNLDIYSQEQSSELVFNLTKIELSISGNNKISEKASIEDSTFKDYNINSEAA